MRKPRYRQLMQDNVCVAILNKVNELSQRYGIEPYEFIATVHYSHNDSDIVLRYESPVSSDKSQEHRFFTMVDSVGVGESTGTLKASPQAIFKALDRALQLAPTSGRGRY